MKILAPFRLEKKPYTSHVYGLLDAYGAVISWLKLGKGIRAKVLS